MNNTMMERQRDIGASAYANVGAVPSDSLNEVICTICFTCNVEQEVADTLVRSYLIQKPDTSNDNLILLFKNEQRRAMMFRTLYARQHPQVNKDTLKSLYTSVPITMNYAEYTQAVDSQLGGVADVDNGFFKFVEDESGPEGGQRSDMLAMFKKRALSENYPADLVEEALSRVSSSTTSYEQFEQLIDSVLDDNQARVDEQKVRDARLKRAIQPELERMWADKDPVYTLRGTIWQTYRTTAVTVPELCEHLRDHEELRLSVYREPIYSIIHQIEKPFVRQAMKECLAKWENNAVVEGVINNYLDALGVPEEARAANRRDLVAILPDNIKNQPAPDAWKQFVAVKLIQKKEHGDTDELTKAIFEDEQAAIDYSARMEAYIEDGAPLEAAQRKAADDYCDTLTDEEKLSLFGKVGRVYGKAVKFKYDAAADMESLMRVSLGDYADQYFDHREEIRARKDELRMLKQEQKLEAKRQKIINKNEMKQASAERKSEERQERKDMRQQEKAMRRGQGGYMTGNRYNDPRFNSYGSAGYGGYGGYGATAYGRTGYGGYGRGGYGMGRGANFAPQIPVFVMAILIHLIVGLLTYVIFGGVKTAFVIVGLALASFGFIRKRVNEPNAIPMIIIGYVIVVLAFVVHK